MRHYPNPEIAGSWDPNWASGAQRIVDCTGFALGEDIKMNPASFKPNNQMLKSKRRDNFCLDVNNGTSNNGETILMWDCHGGNNQKWRLDEKSRLVAAHSGKCLDVTGAQTGNGSRVIQWDCHDGDNQKWEYDAQGRLHPKHAQDKCLDISGDSNQNGANMIIHQCHDGNNQKWFVA